MPPRKPKHSARAGPADSRQLPSSALIIFAKAPVPGQVKTRLCPPLTPDEAASLHGSVVLDMLERSRGAAAMDRFLACSPSSDHVFFKILEERHGVRLITQTGDDLGARMARAMADAFAGGYRHVLVIGTDLPTLPASTFGDAVKLLAAHDLVLGPTLDGGYYLIGLRRPAPELFAGIPWSTDRVLALTRTKASAAGLKTALLPVRRDLDTLDDLLALIEETGAGRETRGVSEARRSKFDVGGQKEPTLEPRTSPSRAEALRHAGSNLERGMLSPRTAGVLRLLASRVRMDQPRTPESRRPAAPL
ncbi:MAG TPA: TIGR04282 family arsenosugar biosynthesis glycosyltransferase [Nitrospiraceae bacterium]